MDNQDVDVNQKFLSDEIKELIQVNKTSNPTDKAPEQKHDFLQEGADFWSKVGSDFAKSYEKGEIISNYNSISEYDHFNLFTSISRIFKEVIREELIVREIDTTRVKLCFNAIDSCFEVLSHQIFNEIDYINKNENAKIENINIDLLFSALHGFVDSYVSKKN